MERTITVRGNEIMVGDVMRFRMTKHDPVRWLHVLKLTPSGNLGTVGVTLEGGCYDRVVRSETRQVKRQF